MDIKPIETVWRGYRFRSRLEARWAVFFTALGLPWEYEPEGFELGDGMRYLPDFRLAGSDTNGDQFEFWVEIKPDFHVPEAGEVEKHRRFAAAQPERYAGDFLICRGLPDLKWYVSQTYEGVGWLLWSRRRRPWWEIEECQIGPALMLKGDWYHDGAEHLPNSPLSDFKQAVAAARAARFEFGEVPA